MSNIQAQSTTASESSTMPAVALKLEVAVLPVADVDRAKRFYAGLGWRLDADFVRKDGSRAVQFTPPGSPCSIHLAETPSFYLVVSDIEMAHAELAKRGVEISEIFHRGEGPGRVSGPDPERRSYASLASFSDPDGNTWLLQEVTARLPGRVDRNVTAFTSPTELAAALRRAAEAHGEHEKRTGGQRDENWPDWYAEYMVREQAGEELPL
ncbi:VOC family protein [Rhizobium leucaenae]|uniref:Catechol 2,3-dioxygenase-like lactoylglutathione lyase family enzyme n=1 Tax=Rhizobium leucaenae TaxID=29450 RepID=A0A7W6ZRS4_9HYPH|nr:catechol 2,3-dioxygenase-like lactoylglutathione lyase family enzyme [Rhizobium leucaenae]MBB6300850.1 catechol 2,3-dioxygenase-like lactoylglutathione lyase family enzyme [Rhizobium leucaenae]